MPATLSQSRDDRASGGFTAANLGSRMPGLGRQPPPVTSQDRLMPTGCRVRGVMSKEDGRLKTPSFLRI